MRDALITHNVANRLKELGGESEGSVPMSRDRIAQAYLGLWGDAATIGKARQRVHWIAGQVRGKRILDVGTSEGILPILLGREGFEVVGIDINEEAITYARQILAAESEAVQDRVTFLNVSLFQDDINTGFDTVVLGEVIEHIVNVENFLAMAMSHVVEGGHLVLTTPFGVFPDRDHKHSFFLTDIMRLLSPHGAIVSLEVADGYIRAVLQNIAAASDPEKDELALLAKTEQAAFEAQTALWGRIDAGQQALSESRAAQVALKKKADGTEKKDLPVPAKRDEMPVRVVTREEVRVLGSNDVSRAASALPADWESLAAQMVAGFNGAAGPAAEQFLRLAKNAATDDPVFAGRLAQLAATLDPRPIYRKAYGFVLLGAGFVEEASEVLRAVAGLEEAPGFSSFEECRYEQLLEAEQKGAPFTAADILAIPATRTRLRVAAVMDPFTYHSYAPECDLMQLTPELWKEELESFIPELLFIESAWKGKGEKWGAKVGQMSSELKGIVGWCKARGIKTVFWNKEDPVHFETFLSTAMHFDIVCTTDFDRVSAYKSVLGHENVHFLPFACQPDTHNPIEIYDRKDAFCFAGAYYVRYPDRTRDLEDLVAHLPTFRPLEIFDRNFGQDNENYMFPEVYRPYIVGTLPPSEIDRAYKGYRFGINLNSVKDSQTMFARRVYELLGSNTVTVSNFSAGLSRVLGDLVIASDSGAKIIELLQATDLERLRLAGLRKVMREHTYGERLAYVVRAAGLAGMEGGLPLVTTVAAAASLAEIKALRAHFRRQAGVEARLVLVLSDKLAEQVAPLRAEGVMALLRGDAVDLQLADIAPEGAMIAAMVAGDYYGPNYLLDLVLATRYSRASAIGRAGYHCRTKGKIDLVNARGAYRPTHELPLRRAILHRALVADEPLAAWVEKAASATISGTEAAPFQAIDVYNYCENGSGPGGVALAGVAETVNDLPGLDTGYRLAELTRQATETLPAEDVAGSAPALMGAGLLDKVVPPKGCAVAWREVEGGLLVQSDQAEGKFVYLYQGADRPVAEVAPDGRMELYLETTPGLHLYWVALFLDKAKQRLGHEMITPNKNSAASIPEGTVWVRFGLRVLGPGRAILKRLILGRRPTAAIPILTRARTLVLTNHYPSAGDLYRNGFVHTRVKAYRAQGEMVDVYRLRPEQDLSFHEFEGVTCMTGSSEQLDSLLAQGAYDSVAVHFLEPAMWGVVEKHLKAGLRLNVWVHGAEVQPWWRRDYNYSTDAERETAKAESDLRLAFWRQVAADIPENLHFVFVSQYFAEEVQEDLGIVFPKPHISIIHNPIETDIFRYEPKTADQRLRVLSIRPFTSATYANDLSVAAILMLKDKPFFNELEFRVIGKGRLFDELTAPLKALPNVQLENRFLSHGEIAALHREYGVFLVPSRCDSQGVSRDEAMSSGLVPITTNVTAIPEFVDEACGFLAPYNDAAGLAQAIETLYHDPDRFLAMSRAAAERVRRQSAANIVVDHEMALFARGRVEIAE